MILIRDFLDVLLVRCLFVEGEGEGRTMELCLFLWKGGRARGERRANQWKKRFDMVGRKKGGKRMVEGFIIVRTTLDFFFFEAENVNRKRKKILLRKVPKLKKQHAESRFLGTPHARILFVEI